MLSLLSWNPMRLLNIYDKSTFHKLTKFDMASALLKDLPPPRMSSMKVKILIARLLQCLIRTLITLVNKNGAVLKPY